MKNYFINLYKALINQSSCVQKKIVQMETKGINIHELLNVLSKTLIKKSEEISTSINDISTAPTAILEYTLFRSRILEDISDVLDRVKARI